MKKFLIITITLIGFLSCQQQQKIGYVDNSELINEYQEKKDIEAKIQLKINAFQKRTDSLRQAFQIEVNEAEIKAKKLSQSGIKKLMQEFQQKEQVLSQRVQFEQQQISQESQAKNDSLIKKVQDFVKEYGKTNGYDYILGSNQAGSVMYGKVDSDLTKTVLEALNSSYSKE